MTDDATPNMLTQVYQDQLDSYNTQLDAIGVGTIGPEYKKQPESLYITYDMRQLDKQLKTRLGQELKNLPQHVQQLIPRSLFSGALHMRAVRDSNIANLAPRRRLMAGYRGLYAHTQLLSQQVTAMLQLQSTDRGAK